MTRGKEPPAARESRGLATPDLRNQAKENLTPVFVIVHVIALTIEREMPLVHTYVSFVIKMYKLSIQILHLWHQY